MTARKLAHSLEDEVAGLRVYRVDRPRVVQQAHPADEGMTWQAIRDVLLAGAAVAAVLYPLFVWLLSLAPAPVPGR